MVFHQTALYELIYLLVLFVVLTWLLHRRKRATGPGTAMGDLLRLLRRAALRVATRCGSTTSGSLGLTGAQYDVHRPVRSRRRGSSPAGVRANAKLAAVEAEAIEQQRAAEIDALEAPDPPSRRRGAARQRSERLVREALHDGGDGLVGRLGRAELVLAQQVGHDPQHPLHERAATACPTRVSSLHQRRVGR